MRIQNILNCLFIAEYQNVLQRLCTTSALTVGSDSTEGATDTSSAEKSDTVKLGLRMMLRSFPFCAPMMMRLGRLHAYLARHCTEYAKTCLAVHPPATLNLSALDHPADISVPLIAVEYLGNLLTAADGSVVSYNVTSCFLTYSDISIHFLVVLVVVVHLPVTCFPSLLNVLLVLHILQTHF